MTETLSERLRAAALLDTHFAVPAERDELVLLLHDAAEELDAIRQRAETALVSGPQPSARAAVNAWMDVFVARSQYFEDTLAKANDKIRDLKRDCIDAGLALQGMRQDNETLRNMLIEARRLVDVGLAARREFLEQAVCHPGPPASEHEDYDPEAPLGELEAAVLERMDLELKAERELWDIRKLCEEALGRTPDPARATIQVVRELLTQPTVMQRLNEQCRDRRQAERAALATPLGEMPVVRPEHFAGPFPAISGYVKRTREARAATIDQALRMLKPGQSLAVHDEPERVDILFLDPGQYPPLGQTWTVYGPAVLDDLPAALAGGSEIHQDAIAAHIKAHGGDPAAATVAQIADALNAVDPNATYKPNAAGNGLDWSPVRRAGVGGSVRIVGGDPGIAEALGLPRPLTPREQDIHDRLECAGAAGHAPKYAYRIDDRLIFSPAFASEPEARRAVAILHARDTAPDVSPAVAAGMATLRANSADRSPGPHPKAEEWQKLIDGLRGSPEQALDGIVAKYGGALNDPETRKRIQGDIASFMASLKDPPPPRVAIDHDKSDLEGGKIAFKVLVSPELAVAVERQREGDAAARLRRTMAEASAEHEGDEATRRRYRPTPPLASVLAGARAHHRRQHGEEYMTPEDIERLRDEEAERAVKTRQVHTLGSPVITIAPGVGNLPAEPLTPEQEAEREERLERFDHDWD